MADEQRAALVDLLQQLVRLLDQVAYDIDDPRYQKLAISYRDAYAVIVRDLLFDESPSVRSVERSSVDSVAARVGRIQTLQREGNWSGIIQHCYDMRDLVARYSALPGQPGSDPIRLPIPPVDDE